MKNLFKKIIIPIITWQAMHILGRFNPKIIAVTGSVGKTSTKDAIFTLLAPTFEVRRSEKSFNSEIGVPLTVLGLRNAWSNPVKWAANLIKGFFISFFSRSYPEVLVLEVGADKLGDIENIVGWIRPDIVVVTALADVPVHVANFPSIESVYEEKGKLVEALDKEGTAVLNMDDRRVFSMRGRTEARVLTFGLEGADVGPECIEMPLVASPYPALAAAAVAKVMGMEADEIKELSHKIKTPSGRMNVLEGVNGSTIIDDSYNSSPVAAEYALKVLKDFHNKSGEPGRKIAALGDMRELGEYAKEEHMRVGRLAAEFASLLVTVGPLSHDTALAAEEAGINKENIKEFLDSREAGRYLKEQIQPGDVILAKGSQNTIRMERLVLELLAHPEHDQHLLVRQDKEWATH